jgi:hypothetical protein
MAKISDIARITKRGTDIPDVGDELAYSAYCLYEAVRSEMQKHGDYEEVNRAGVSGFEGPVSVPTVMRFLWVGMSRTSELDDEARQARIILYQYLRDTKNLICVKPGNQRTTSVWWARNEWNDEVPAATTVTEPAVQHKEEKTVNTARDIPAQALPVPSLPPVTPSADPALPDRLRDYIISPEGTPVPEAICCGKKYTSQRHLTRHIYDIHHSIRELIVSSLMMDTGKEGLTLAALSNYMQEHYSYVGSREMVRHHLTMMLEAADPYIKVTAEPDRYPRYSATQEAQNDFKVIPSGSIRNPEITYATNNHHLRPDPALQSQGVSEPESAVTVGSEDEFNALLRRARTAIAELVAEYQNLLERARAHHESLKVPENTAATSSRTASNEVVALRKENDELRSQLGGLKKLIANLT